MQCCYGRPKKGDKVGVDISNVIFERVSIAGVCEAICVAAGAPVSTATMKDIVFRDVTAEAFASTIIAGNGTTRPDGIVFENCAFRLSASAEALLFEDREFGVLSGDPNGAFRVEKTGRVSFRNCSLAWDPGVPKGFNRAFSLFDAPPPEICRRSVLKDR